MRRLAIALAALVLLSVAPRATWADMYPDASNAKLPEARTNLQLQPVSALDIGFKNDGTTDNSAAMTTAFARTDSPTLYFPPGTYMLGCPTATRNAASAISIKGGGPATIFKFNPGCTMNAMSIFAYHEKSGVRISDFTFDMNTPATPPSGGNGNLFIFYAYTADITSGGITNIRVLNGPGRASVLFLGANAGHTISDFHIDDNYLHQAVPSYSPNQCIALTNNTNSGVIKNITIDRNTCVNSAIQVEAQYSSVSGNDISGFAFGNGIYAISSKNHHLTVTNNRIHDSGAAQRDSSGISTSGMETPDKSIICNNIFYNLAGPGIVNFGKYNLICNNISYNNGNLSVSASPVPNEGDWAGFHTPLYGGQLHGAYTRYVGNKAYDDRGAGAKQLYGYFDWGTDAVPGISFSGNEFYGYGAGRAYKTGNPVVGDASYTSTVANLPACGAATKNSAAAVSDQLSVPTYRGALTGGGAIAVLAYCNGTSWEAH